MVNLYANSLNITLMINVLQGLLKIKHSKMLQAINLYWFHNNASEKNKSINSYSNEPWINE